MSPIHDIVITFIDKTASDDFIIKEVNRIVDAGDGTMGVWPSLCVLFDDLPWYNTKRDLVFRLFQRYSLKNERANKVMKVLVEKNARPANP